MPKRIEWVECPECSGIDSECKCCRGGGEVPVLSYEPAALMETNPWKELDR